MRKVGNMRPVASSVGHTRLRAPVFTHSLTEVRFVFIGGGRMMRHHMQQSAFRDPLNFLLDEYGDPVPDLCNDFWLHLEISTVTFRHYVDSL